jgi:GTP cyclohydrolase I
MDTVSILDNDLDLNLTEITLQQAIKTRFPSPIKNEIHSLSKEEKIAKIKDKFHDIMEILGLDLTDESLARTPFRVAKMYVDEIFSGLDPSTFPEMSFVEDAYQQHTEPANMVFIKVEFCSFCEHHFIPMNGTAFIAYLPNGKLIGLSKIPRLVRFFARRPQLQERLTAQIADSLSTLLNTESVAVSLQAEHQCIKARGIECENSQTITNVLKGQFANHDLKTQFFEAINRVKT